MKSFHTPGTPGTFEQAYSGRSEHPRPWSAEASQARHDQIEGIDDVAARNSNLMVTDAKTGLSMPYAVFAKKISARRPKPVVAPTRPDIAEKARQEMIELTMTADVAPRLKVQWLKHLGYTALPLAPKVANITPASESHEAELPVAV